MKHHKISLALNNVFIAYVLGISCRLAGQLLFLALEARLARMSGDQPADWCSEPPFGWLGQVLTCLSSSRRQPQASPVSGRCTRGNRKASWGGTGTLLLVAYSSGPKLSHMDKSRMGVVTGWGVHCDVTDKDMFPSSCEDGGPSLSSITMWLWDQLRAAMASLDSSLCFIQPNISHNVLCM